MSSPGYPSKTSSLSKSELLHVHLSKGIGEDFLFLSEKRMKPSSLVGSSFAVGNSVVLTRGLSKLPSLLQPHLVHTKNSGRFCMPQTASPNPGCARWHTRSSAFQAVPLDFTLNKWWPCPASSTRSMFQGNSCFSKSSTVAAQTSTRDAWSQALGANAAGQGARLSDVQICRKFVSH